MKILRNIVLLLSVWVIAITVLRYGVIQDFFPEDLNMNGDFKSWHSRESYFKGFSDFFEWLEKGPGLDNVKKQINLITRGISTNDDPFRRRDILSLIFMPFSFVIALIIDIVSIIGWLVTGIW